MVKLFSIAPKASPLNKEKHQALHIQGHMAGAAPYSQAPLERLQSRPARCREAMVLNEGNLKRIAE